jgi:hypothetical protein
MYYLRSRRLPWESCTWHNIFYRQTNYSKCMQFCDRRVISCLVRANGSVTRSTRTKTMKRAAILVVACVSICPTIALAQTAETKPTPNSDFLKASPRIVSGRVHFETRLGRSEQPTVTLAQTERYAGTKLLRKHGLATAGKSQSAASRAVLDPGHKSRPGWANPDGAQTMI